MRMRFADARDEQTRHASVAHVGRASTSAATAVTNPSGTRRRARNVGDASRHRRIQPSRRDSALDRRDDLVHADVVDARLRQPAAALVVADALRRRARS